MKLDDKLKLCYKSQVKRLTIAFMKALRDKDYASIDLMTITMDAISDEIMNKEVKQ